MSKNILLVDDEVITNVVHKSVLNRSGSFGYIESVLNGRQALEFLERAITENKPLPDYIFLDINMPVMNGFDFLQDINNHFAIDHEKMKIIMLSSSIDPRDKIRARELGADDFICKPLGPPDLQRIFSDAEPQR
ncbi:response regulator [Pseudochryseolinea flava]|uniref:response regulator n=1 Tax=Pseudochryseolinea flava TaxID=2059302 RepID=UPI001403D3A4|nr:response regulator [Pseudochryseolinea flava]